MSVTIYHNPDCGTSRNVLALLREAGEDPHVIEYLKTPPERATLERIIADTGMALRDVLRIKGTPYKELGLGNPALSDAQLIDAILAHPILMNRPIVVTPRGTRLCRPSDSVVGLLDRVPGHEILKEEGVPFIVARAIAGNDAGLAEALWDADLPCSDLKEPDRNFFAFSTLGGSHVGYGGFEQFGGDVLLRSVVVETPHRGKGIGRNLIALILRQALIEAPVLRGCLPPTQRRYTRRRGSSRSRATLRRLRFSLPARRPTCARQRPSCCHALLPCRPTTRCGQTYRTSALPISIHQILRSWSHGQYRNIRLASYCFMARYARRLTAAC